MAKRLDPKEAEAIMLKGGLKPTEPYSNSKKPWKCECVKCGRVVSPSLSNVRNRNSIGCVYCNNRLTDSDTATKRMLQQNLLPLEPFIDGRTPWKSRCMLCGAVVQPILHDIRRGYGGCRKCGIKKQALTTRTSNSDAIKVMGIAKLIPIEPYKGSNRPWKSRCQVCGEVVAPTFSSIKAGASCRICAFERMGKAQRLSEDEAVNRMLRAKLQPLEPYVNASKPWKSLCLVCGETVNPHLTSITKGGGCFYCAVAGIQMNKPSYIYLITHSELSAHKIGIGNKRKNRDRLKKFMNRGWEPHKVWEVETGAQALKIEKEVFRVLRKEMNIPSYLSAEQMPVTGGETETVDAETISLLQLEKIINKVSKQFRA